jgi:hypothetical protein
MEALAGNAHLSFEGDLRDSKLKIIPGISTKKRSP